MADETPKTDGYKIVYHLHETDPSKVEAHNIVDLVVSPATECEVACFGIPASAESTVYANCLQIPAFHYYQIDDGVFKTLNDIIFNGVYGGHQKPFHEFMRLQQFGVKGADTNPQGIIKKTSAPRPVHYTSAAEVVDKSGDENYSTQVFEIKIPPAYAGIEWIISRVTDVRIKAVKRETGHPDEEKGEAKSSYLKIIRKPPSGTLSISYLGVLPEPPKGANKWVTEDNTAITKLNIPGLIETPTCLFLMATAGGGKGGDGVHRVDSATKAVSFAGGGGGAGACGLFVLNFNSFSSPEVVEYNNRFAIKAEPFANNEGISNEGISLRITSEFGLNDIPDYTFGWTLRGGENADNNEDIGAGGEGGMVTRATPSEESTAITALMYDNGGKGGRGSKVTFQTGSDPQPERKVPMEIGYAPNSSSEEHWRSKIEAEIYANAPKKIIIDKAAAGNIMFEKGEIIDPSTSEFYKYSIGGGGGCNLFTGGDGARWTVYSESITPPYEMTTPCIEAEAAKYGQGGGGGIGYVATMVPGTSEHHPPSQGDWESIYKKGANGGSAYFCLRF